jgi:hypothetical protein
MILSGFQVKYLKNPTLGHNGNYFQKIFSNKLVIEGIVQKCKLISCRSIDQIWFFLKKLCHIRYQIIK